MNGPIDLNQSRTKIRQNLENAIVDKADQDNLTPREIVKTFLNIFDNLLLDDELEENLIIDLANAFHCATIHPQYEINNGFDGNDGTNEE